MAEPFRPSAHGWRGLPLLALLLALLPVPAGAQEGCEWLAPTRDLQYQTIGSTTILRVNNPHLRCQDGVRLRADSARHFENNDFFQLFGNAVFENPEERLEGDVIRYWRNEDRIEAEGGVRLTRLADGSVITGENMGLLQAGELRDEDQLTVTSQRPRVVFHPERGGEGADTTAAPWDIVADRLFFEGRSYLVASGEVEVRRDSVEAFADALEYDEREDLLLLRRDARMVMPGYELVGDSIRGRVVDAEIEMLTAFDRAVLTGEDLRIAAPRIVVAIPEGAVERLVATRMPGGGRASRAEAPPDSVSLFEMEHPPRPVARAEDFFMVADSVDVQAPGEVLQRIVAVGRARGESTARDSLNLPTTPEIARRDWIDGDTIIASFVPVEASEPVPDEEARGAEEDEGPRYRLDELVARVNARSLYRMVPADSVEALEENGDAVRLAIHYVTGKEITISLDEGEVRLMRVVGPTEGIHLEPMGGRPADTAAADTASADTTSARSGPAGARPATPGSGPRVPAVPGDAAETAEPAVQRSARRISRKGRGGPG